MSAEVPIFARVRAAVVECPRCQRICQLDARAPKDTRRLEGGGWDPLSSVWACPCGARWVVGVRIVALRGAATGEAPEDTKAGPRQAAQLREIAGGRWASGAWRGGTINRGEEG